MCNSKLQIDTLKTHILVDAPTIEFDQYSIEFNRHVTEWFTAKMSSVEAASPGVIEGGVELGFALLARLQRGARAAPGASNDGYGYAR